ncbi:CHAP domain-containing protein [Acinetobacter qingfengensis]|uniref:Amidase n=1 Tax=Acinetobacter qingfengensis TaxID=1262585 RepID=A0A1E7QWP6_9GAMM|nr:CHAP domain-containing protein [Acinetobacter qingfengensis]OEY91525.1 amidase [Acinetobacter qingfengensis]
MIASSAPSEDQHDNPWLNAAILSAQQKSGVDIQKFTRALSRITATRSSARCARSIRIALQTAGAKIISHPIAASDWGGTLEQIGYKEINPAFDNPQKGDIYIIHRTASHTYGHIAGYSGSQWISDFRQSSHDVYRDSNVTYSYYRLI